MAIDVYLHIDGIKGESADSAHQGWIELTSAPLGRDPAPKCDSIYRRRPHGGKVRTSNTCGFKACRYLVASPVANLFNGADDTECQA